MNKKYYESINRKRIASGALIFNENKELLIVKPTYKEGWNIVGGAVEENESPKNACLREVEEEIGLKFNSAEFVSTDYKIDNDARGERIQFIFNCGILNEEQISKIKLNTEENSEFKFLPIEKAILVIREVLRESIPKSISAMKNKCAIYLENGK